MSVHFVSGKPGGGKSLWACQRIVDELVNGRRVVVTNLALKLGELNAYLQKEYPKASVNLQERVRILTTEEVFEFWLHRGGLFTVEGDACLWSWCDLKSETTERGSIRIDFSKAKGLASVLYVVDEIHEFFNAREWMKTGKGALHYLSQHRKLGDEVICITQSINNVDKQFRSVSQDFTYLRNHKNERFLGVFQAPGLFTWRTYQSPVTGAPGESATAYGTFKLDVAGLASCYDTAVGVGIVGSGADIGQRSKGVPAWVLIVVLFVGLGAFWYGPEALLKAFFGPGKGAVKMASAVPGATNDTPGPILLVPTNGVVSGALSSAGAVRAPDPRPAASVPPASQPEVYLNGVASIGRKAFVFLSDGRTFTTDDRELTFVSPRLVVIDKTVYRFRPAAAFDHDRHVSSGMLGTIR